MVLSKTGQEVVIKDGYIPLPAKVIKKRWQLLNNPLFNGLLDKDANNLNKQDIQMKAAENLKISAAFL